MRPDKKPQTVESAGMKWERAVMVCGVLASVAMLALAASAVRLPSQQAGSLAGDGVVPELVISRVDTVPAKDGLREKLWLLNPSPLYMPAEDNGGPSGLAERPGGRAGEQFRPMLSYPERTPGMGILRWPVPASALEKSVDLAEARWFSGMARSLEGEKAAGVKARRIARISLFKLGEAGPKSGMDIMQDSVLESVVWRPVEMTVVVDEVGAVTRPSMTSSSGEERADERIREVVGREFLPKSVLRPGIYRIEIGP